MPIKKIIHCGDIHIRNLERHEEYEEQLSKFINKCQEIANNYEKDEIRILIAGDLLHQKNNITAELVSAVSNFIRSLEEIAKVIVIAGNHDLVVDNLTRQSAIGSIFESCNFENSYLLDSALGYESGYVEDDNITWCLYSIFDNFNCPNIDLARKENPDNKFIGLYHGMVVGSKLYSGLIADSGVQGSLFEGCDCVMAGDIHKYQELKRGGIKIVYPGSLIQQNHGETVTQHGFVVWDVETLENEFIELESEYGMYNFEIQNVEDIDEDKEILVNY